MNEAQKFLLNNECDDLRLKDAHKVENWIYVSDMMERYHQKQVKKLLLHNVSQQREPLNDLEKKQFIEDIYWLNLQNLSGREDFEQAFKLGIETGINETL
jgi:hypothetical protein